MGFELEYSKEFLSRLKKGLTWLTWLLVAIGVLILGRTISPKDKDGKPLFLTPHLARIADYQHQVRNWALELKDIHAGLVSVISDQPNDLFDQDGKVNQLYGQLTTLQEEVDGTEVPQTQEQLQILAGDAVAAYLDATESTIAWLNEPTKANFNQAEAAMKLASEALDRVLQNPWMQIQP